MAAKKSIKKPVSTTEALKNPLIVEDSSDETIHNVRAVITYLMFTAPEYASGGASDIASTGLTLVLETCSQALEHVESEVAHG
jgi:hypothetical protein